MNRNLDRTSMPFLYCCLSTTRISQEGRLHVEVSSKLSGWTRPTTGPVRLSTWSCSSPSRRATAGSPTSGVLFLIAVDSRHSLRASDGAGAPSIVRSSLNTVPSRTPSSAPSRSACARSRFLAQTMTLCVRYSPQLKTVTEDEQRTTRTAGRSGARCAR